MAANGFVPVRQFRGGPWNGKTKMYLCQASNAIYVGDPVILNGGAGAAGVFVNGVNCEGMPDVDRAAATSTTIVGVVVGFLPLQSNLELLYKAADSTKRIALVADDPDTVFEVEEDSVGTNIASTQVGHNFDMITWAAGNNTTGQSIMALDSSDTTGTSTAQWRVLGLANRPGNAFGTTTTTYGRFEVICNEHVFKTTTGS